MKYKIGDIVEVNLSPKKGYSQKTPPVIALIKDVDDTKINFKKTAYYVLLMNSLNETCLWVELEMYKLKKLTD